MAIRPGQVGQEIKLNEIDEAMANDLDRNIEKKLSLSEEGKDLYVFDIEIKGRLNGDIIKTVERRYLEQNWKEVRIDTKGHTQWDSASDPFVYTVKLKA